MAAKSRRHSVTSEPTRRLTSAACVLVEHELGSEAIVRSCVVVVRRVRIRAWLLCAKVAPADKLAGRERAGSFTQEPLGKAA